MRSGAAFGVAVLLAACGSDASDPAERQRAQALADEVGPSIEARLKSLDEVVRLLDAVPRGTASKSLEPWRIPPTRVFKTQNLFYVHESDLKDWTYQKAEPRLGDLMPWMGAKEELHRIRDQLARPDWTGSYATYPLRGADELFRRVEYLLVLRGTYTVPDGDLQTKSFNPGRFTGDAQVFDLEGPRHLGGFPLDVRNDQKVMVSYDPKAAFRTIQDDLVKDLTGNLLSELARRIRTLGRVKLPS